MNITEHETYQLHDCRLVCNIVGGSHLYGLNTATSDVDYRAIFVAMHKLHLTGFRTVDSIVQVGDVDLSAHELGRYLQLLRKTNTQVLELLFAPDSAFQFKHPDFKLLEANKYQLMCTATLKNSLVGYVISEMKLATGERTGQLGGKRKEAVAAYGFSPKNFVQIFRLCAVGTKFFETGEFMVNVQEHDPALHAELLDIKTHPEKYSKEELVKRTVSMLEDMKAAMDKSELHYEFDDELAADILLHFRNINRAS